MPAPEELKKAREAYTNNVGTAADPSDEAKAYFTLLMKEAKVKVPGDMKVTMRAVRDEDKVLTYVIQGKGSDPVAIEIPMTPVREKEKLGPVIRTFKNGQPGEVIQTLDKDDKLIEGRKMGMTPVAEKLMALAAQFNAEPVPPGTSLSGFKAIDPKDRGRA